MALEAKSIKPKYIPAFGPVLSTKNPLADCPTALVTKKVVIKAPASTKFKLNAGISQGNKDGMTKW